MGLLVATSVSNAAAEESGWFVGTQLGYGSVSARAEYDYLMQNNAKDHTFTIYGVSIPIKGFNINYTTSADSGWQSAPSFRYGFLLGYKQFFTPKFGLRYYATFDGSTISKHKIVGANLIIIKDDNYSPTQSQYYNAIIQSPNDKESLSMWKININVDVLYNFIVRENLDFGVFAGLSIGPTSSIKVKAAFDTSVPIGKKTFDVAYPYNGELSVDGGFDFAINLGLRANIAKHHGIELYSHFSFVEQKGEYVYSDTENYGYSWLSIYERAKTSIKVKQPYAVGLRYVFSF